MQNNFLQVSDAPIQYATGSSFVDQVRSNVKSDLIVITEDKLENIFLKHLKALNIRMAWLSPSSALATLLLSLATATFTDKFGFKADQIQFLFVIFSIASGVWLLISLLKMLVLWKKASIPFLVRTIKNAK